MYCSSGNSDLSLCFSPSLSNFCCESLVSSSSSSFSALAPYCCSTTSSSYVSSCACPAFSPCLSPSSDSCSEFPPKCNNNANGGEVIGASVAEEKAPGDVEQQAGGAQEKGRISGFVVECEKKESSISVLKKKTKRKKKKNNNNKAGTLEQNGKICGNKKLNSVSKSRAVCDVCISEEGKYKFKCCGKKFCSVPCFKAHDSKICVNNSTQTCANNRDLFIKKNKKCISGVSPDKYKTGKSHSNVTSLETKEEDKKVKLIGEEIESGENEKQQEMKAENTHEESFNSRNETNEIKESFDDDYVLTEKEKYLLINNLELRRYFQDKTLRSVLREIAATKYRRAEAFRYFLNDKLFNDFIDEVMKTIQGAS